MNQSEYLRAIGCPLEHVTSLPSADPTVAALKQLADAVENRDLRAIVLWGARGAGKTLAAVWWLANAGRYVSDWDGTGWFWLSDRALFAKAYELGRLNLRFDRDDRVRFERLKTVRFLALDDLAAEMATPESQALVEELLDHRLSNGGRTLITTNAVCGPDLDKSPFAQRYGTRTTDRLFARGRFVGCGATNLRRGGA